jgi:cation-transporting P-type ATPase E
VSPDAVPASASVVAAPTPAPIGDHGVPDLPADLGPTPDAGLSTAEAAARAGRGLGNDARIATGRTYPEILRDNVLQPVNILLGIICLVLAALGLYGDAAVTIVLVLVNVVVGLVQEVRAKRSLDRLSVLTRPTATVIRDGTELTIDPTGVVLGDLLLIRRGDQLLLDGKVSAGTFQADESLLTGESDRIPKILGSEVLSGSFCVDGEAHYVATRVGAGTFANQLTAGARAFRADRTPLQRDVAKVLRGMSLLVLVAAVPVLIRMYSQYGSLPAIETARAAAVLVALIPQGLVVMITVTYAMAIVRLAGQKALIQRSNAVESMSRVSVLCLDKTGTLTTPEIEVAEVHPLTAEAELVTWLGSFVASTSLQNRSSDAIHARYPDGVKLAVAEEVPFSSELRWSAIRVSDGALTGAFVLGAPEVLGPRLASVPGGHGEMDRLVAEKAGQGLRVVLFARRQGATLPLIGLDDQATLPAELEPMGVLVLQEQIRPDARATLARFADAGVTLKLISGDNPVTVAALARQVGLSLDGEAISGLELAEMDDAQLSEAVRTRSVFGRVPPSLKARLVGTLRESGEWVAMVGDGVNDILSLKQAQLGISMQSGSQATRAVADIVLLDDSFSALPEAVLEGQRIIAGMHDSLAVFLTRVLYMALAILGASVVGLAMPVDPKLNTVVALLTVGIPALFLAVWARPQRSAPDALRQILRLVAPPAVALVVLGLPLYWWADPGAELERARTLFTTFAVFCGLALLPLLHPPFGRAQDGSEQDHPDIRPTVLALVMLLLFGLFFIIPPLRDFFELTPLSWSDVLVTAVLASVWVGLVRVLWHTGMYDRVMTEVHGLRARSRGQPAA